MWVTQRFGLNNYMNLWFVFHVGERRRWEGIILYVMLVQQRVNSVVQLFFFPLTSFPLSFWPKHSDFALGQSFLLPSSSNNSRDIGLAYQRHIPDHKGLFRDGHVTSEPTRWNIGILAGNIEKGILFFFFFPAGSEPGRYLHSSLPTTQSLRMKPKWKPGDSRDGQTGLKDRILTFEKSHSWNSHTFGFLVTWVSTF